MLRDRRRFHRWTVSIPCICEAEEGSFTGKVVNLSFGGARVENTDRIPREGSDLQITLHLKDYSVSLSAHVFYIDPEDQHFGIEFYGSRVERIRQLLPLFRASVEKPATSDD
jgi:hypothetical protein